MLMIRLEMLQAELGKVQKMLEKEFTKEGRVLEKELKKPLVTMKDHIIEDQNTCITNECIIDDPS